MKRVSIEPQSRRLTKQTLRGSSSLSFGCVALPVTSPIRSPRFIKRSDDSNHAQSLARLASASISVVFNATINPCCEWSAMNDPRSGFGFFADA
jgi:hypothetical protein